MTAFDWFLIAFVVLGSVAFGIALRFGIRPPPAPPPTLDEYLAGKKFPE